MNQGNLFELLDSPTVISVETEVPPVMDGKSAKAVPHSESAEPQNIGVEVPNEAAIAGDDEASWRTWCKKAGQKPDAPTGFAQDAFLAGWTPEQFKQGRRRVDGCWSTPEEEFGDSIGGADSKPCDTVPVRASRDLCAALGSIRYQTGIVHRALDFAARVRTFGCADRIETKGGLDPMKLACLANGVLRGIESDRPTLTEERLEMALEYVVGYLSAKWEWSPPECPDQVVQITRSEDAHV